MKRIILTLTLALFTLPIAKAQDIKLNGTTSAESNQIKNVADPTDNQDAGTKAYIDALISDLQNQINDLKPLEDVDGNNYDFISYGDQTWSVENAKMVRYRDGTEIPQVTDATQWANLTTGAWCYYDNDSSKGKLYNWYAVAGIHDNDDNTPNKTFAPEGWHVPTDAEWTTLEEYLIANGYNYDGTTTWNRIAKSMASTTGWNSITSTGAVGNDPSSNNSSGFNAFPEGYRSYNGGSFFNEGNNAFFWSSTESNSNFAWYRNLNYNGSYLNRLGGSELYGFSVRFVRD